jgi:hypothetical protein
VIKVTDFGLSKDYGGGSALQTSCGKKRDGGDRGRMKEGQRRMKEVRGGEKREGKREEEGEERGVPLGVHGLQPYRLSFHFAPQTSCGKKRDGGDRGGMKEGQRRDEGGTRDNG